MCPCRPDPALTTAVLLAAIAVAAGCASSSRPAPAPAKALAVSQAQVPEPIQTVSLLGQPLTPQPMDAAKRTEREAALLQAQAALNAEPASVAAAIWVGRRQAYLGDYRGAIDTYTRALTQHPDSYRLLRHRGHRWITLRAFDRAVADLTLAWSLAQHHPDAVEPDGLPTPGVAPRSTDHGNILYHLALAQYLQGDFVAAAEHFGQAAACAHNDDSLVAATYWQVNSLRRAGQVEAASRLLSRVRTPAAGGMDVLENHTYYGLLLAFAGHLPTATLSAGDSAVGISVERAGLGYGLAQQAASQGDPATRDRLLREVIEQTDWAAFGHIAAEADLARAAPR